MIIAPTHELAIQIHRQCGELAQNAGWPVRSLLLIGGTSTERQIDKLKKKPHVVVGSPGRIAELLSKGKLKAQHVRSIVIDEADRLLSEESLLAVRAIVQAAPRTRQLIFASATLEREATAIVKELAPEVVMLRRAPPRSTKTSSIFICCARSATNRMSCGNSYTHSHRNAPSCSSIAMM